MARMKTLITYGLCIVGFIFLSYLLENALLGNMYITMRAETPSLMDGVEIENVEAKASNVSGYMSFKVTDKSQGGKQKYIQIDLYNKKGNLVATKYIPIEDLDKNGQKEYAIKLKGHEIRHYKLSVIDELPNKDSINTEGIMGKAREVWGWTTSFLKSVPWWGYAIGGAIILWYMPAKFLFGVFPI